MSNLTPMEFDVPGLRDARFDGFTSIAQLRRTKCAAVPSDPGVYVVLRTSEAAARWLDISPGGHFKGRDPTVPVSVLRERLIKGTPVVYIGKADVLKRRLDQYVRFGAGVPIGHWGGRYIWQLADADELLIAWLAHPHPRQKESELIEQFIDRFGSMPLANLQR